MQQKKSGSDPDFFAGGFMRSLIVVVALVFAFPAHAQPAQDANPRAEQNTQGATPNADAMDPATKARVRLEGVPGGPGARVPPEANGGATVGDGQPNRHFLPVPAEPQIGVPRQDKSSDRDEGRNVSGATR
jgi:hypothetical protein